MGTLADSVLRSRAFRRFVTALEDRVPPLRAWHRFEYQRHFSEQSEKTRMFAGVYDNFQAAAKAVPPGATASYDHSKLADRHTSEIGHIWPSDYPVLFWLRSLLHEQVRVFDLGGTTGLLFYSFQKYLSYPKGLAWIICEVPAVASRGTEIAKQRGAEGLSFTTRFEDAEGADILLASASLQFIETPLPVSLARLARRPRHLLINRTPLCEGPSFATLHNIGNAICPYQVLNKKEFVGALEALGYRAVDEWEAAEFSCYIPFHPQRGLRTYSGMYLQASGT